MNQILAFSREAGGAAAMLPVLLELRPSARILLLAKDYAEQVFRDGGLEPLVFPDFSDAALRQALAAGLGTDRPAVVFTSATSLPQLDMTERRLWHWAREHQVVSVALVDQWQHYALRFSGSRPEEHLGYLPDWIAVMDDYARREMVACGIPAERIVVTGQPVFDRLAKIRATYSAEDRNEARRMLGVDERAALVCFVAEAVFPEFAARLGYNEHAVLGEMIGICRELADTRGPVHLAVKLHPRNDPSIFAWVRRLAVPEELRVTLHWTEQPSVPLVMASDAVVGMSSILLVESIVLGRPTLSFQPNARDRDLLIATAVGAIPLLGGRETCLATLRGVLDDPTFRKAYLERQSCLAVSGDATGKVADLVLRAAAGQANDNGWRRAQVGG